MDVRKVLLALSVVGGLVAPAVTAVADPPKKLCAPEHPAPQPGFKPGVCDK